MKRIGAAILASAFALSASPACAQPPENADPELKPFFRSLTLPNQPSYYCCNESDCRPVSTKHFRKAWYAFIDRKTYGADAPDEWRHVPPEAVIKDENLPKAKRPWTAVACYFQGNIRCFVKPPQGM